MDLIPDQPYDPITNPNGYDMDWQDAENHLRLVREEL